MEGEQVTQMRALTPKHSVETENYTKEVQIENSWLSCQNLINCARLFLCVFLCLADLFLKEKNMNHTRSYTSAIIKCYVWVLTFVFDKGTVSGLHDVFYLKWYDYQPLREDREGSWEIKESCVVTVVFPDAGSGPPFRLCRCCIALLLCMVTHMERGWKVNVRFLKRWEPPSSAGLFHLWDVSLEAVWLLCQVLRHKGMCPQIYSDVFLILHSIRSPHWFGFFFFF